MLTMSIPSDITDVPQWILWKLEVRDGKQTKVPCRIDATPADVTDPGSWLSFERALDYFDGEVPSGPFVANGHPCGFGLCFTEEDDLFGIDMDDCLPRLSPAALEILAAFPTYAEVSPSGTGIKLFGRGRKPDGARFRTSKVDGLSQLEVYDRERFFTVTGNWFGMEPKVTDCQESLTWLCDLYLPARQDRTESGTVSPVAGAGSLLERAGGFEGSDEDLILYLCDDPKYAALWHGDFSDYGDEGQSEADAALVEKIAWLAGPFPERIARIFEASALCRSKWHERPDYRDRTIDLALSGKTDFYSGGGHAALDAEDVPTPLPVSATEAFEEEAGFPIPESGIIRDFVDLIGPMTESPDSTIAFGALIMLSAVAGWSRQIRWGENAEPVTLYGCICGKSAVGRKTTGMRSVENVTAEAYGPGELRMESGGHISGRALIEAAVGSVEIFYTKEPKVTALDEEEREAENAALADWHAKRDDLLQNPPATVLVWDEFGKILNVDKDWQRDTRMELLRMYGGWHGGIKTSGKEGLKMPKGKVQMGLLATMTDDDLRRGLNAAQVTDGLMGRIIFTPDGNRKPPLSRPPMKGADYDLKKQALISKLLRFREKCAGAPQDCYDNWTTEANKSWDAWYQSHYERDTGLHALLFGRLQITGVKIATLLAMAEGIDFVDADHIALATSMIDISIQVAMDAAETAAEAQRDRYCQAVYDLVVAEGPQPLSWVLKRGMLGAKEPGEKMPEQELRTIWLKKHPRLVVEKGESGKGHRVALADDA